MEFYGLMEPIEIFNISALILLTLCFFYQYVYIVFMLFSKPKAEELHRASTHHRFAVLVAAHNEDVVIAQLIESIRSQDYPRESVDVFVIADGCTDDTVSVARDAGAIVLERPVGQGGHGKSYVMQYGMGRIREEYAGLYEAVLILDADNLLSPDYIARMNDMYDQGFDVSTSYRASKNFDSSWISGGYALWFLRESKYLNNARMRLGTGCAVSGTGYFVSTRLLRELGDWNFHTLTEDIQFSVWCAINGYRIGYAKDAIFYDEQPITFEASWLQRMRWTRGFYQVFWHYGKDLIKQAFAHRNFAAYDLLMTIAPASLITIASVIVNSIIIVLALMDSSVGSTAYLTRSVASIGFIVGFMYLMFFSLGLLTSITEERNIHASKGFVIRNIFTFPLFMFTYVPIAIWALVKPVRWVPTVHTQGRTLEQVLE